MLTNESFKCVITGAATEKRRDRIIVHAKVKEIGHIDRSTPMPLYFQIAERLRNHIHALKMRPGDLLTTDDQVQEQFRVSRATARKAIDELVDEGVVKRVTGKGTFVTKPRLQVPLPTMFSFTEELERRGMHPTTRVVSVGWFRASVHAAQALELPTGARVMRLERIRYADDRPILHTVDNLPEGLGIGPGEDFSGSLYQLMESRGIQLAECQNLIQAGVTDVHSGKLLRVKNGFPVLVLRRTSYDSEGHPVLYEDATCRGDMYSYAVRLARQPVRR
jgi:GntR family transcriptional regulator